MILTLIDHDRGQVARASWEALTFARDLAGRLEMPLAAAVVDPGADQAMTDLGTFGVAQVFHLTHAELDEYAPDAWARGLQELIQAHRPEAVLAPGTVRGNEVLARLGARLDLPMAANCVRVDPGDDAYRVVRVRWGGSLLEEADLPGGPKLLTVAANSVEAMPAEAAVEPQVQVHTPELQEKDLVVKVVERVEGARDKVSLVDARVVVGGGRGVGSAEGFRVLEELAELLGGAVGCSRAVTNEGWRPHSDQIGQTGTRIAPEIYIACGISGAIQHYVGCKGAKHILAINTDPEAAMVAKADWAVIADLHQVVPAICQEIRRRRNG